MIRVPSGREEFAELSRGLSVVPVYCSILSDQLTPVSGFERVAPEAEHAFPLESVVGGEKIACCLFLEARPFFLVEADDRQTETVSGLFLDILSRASARAKGDVQPQATVTKTILKPFMPSSGCQLLQLHGPARIVSKSPIRVTVDQGATLA